MKQNKLYLLASLMLFILLFSCSTKKNTRASRFYHAFTARYNTYFNGHEAYKEGKEAMLKSNKDNYFEKLPLFLVGNKKTRGIGKSNFNRAIEKAQKAIKQHSIKRKPKRKAGKRKDPKYQRWMAQKEYNPFLHKVWMMMGEAQYQKGDFLEAASTFAYISRLYRTQPKVLALAHIWLARCYTEINWFYDAEDALSKANNDSLPHSLLPNHASAYCNFLLKQARFSEAIPYLLTTIKNEKKRLLKARKYYLLGQLYQNEEKTTLAYKAYNKVVRMNPPFELELNANIRQTEVLPSSETEKVLKKLKRMVKSPRNKDYLDHVYYAIGNVHLNSKDTIKAIIAYNKGIKFSQGNGMAKANLLITLGNLHWIQQNYIDAQTCYAELLGLLNKENKEYKLTDKRSKILDLLVEDVKKVELQDSLQRVARMSEKQRSALIDSIINAVMEEERLAAEAERLQKRRDRRTAMQENDPNFQKNTTTNPTLPVGDKSWYFYNTQLITQGKAIFDRQWGNRKAEDNWRQRNKTVVQLDTEENYDYTEEEETDSIIPENRSKAEEEKIALNDNKSPLFYLKEIPLTPEKLKASNIIIMDAMFNIGITYKDKLEDYLLAQNEFQALIKRYPTFERMDEVYYHLYLLNARYHKEILAQTYKQKLTKTYPESEYTRTINNPNFVKDAVYGEHLEDSLYADTYQAYLHQNYRLIEQNYKYAQKRYALGAHIPKFMFLQCMNLLHKKEYKTFKSLLKKLIQSYPTNEITDLASHIMKGLQEGRLLSSDASSFGSIWERRNESTVAGKLVKDSLMPEFTAEHNTPFLFIIAYEKGKINQDLLLYEVAKYNFSTFMIKNFDLDFEETLGIGLLKVSTFTSFEEAIQYRHLIFSDKDRARKLSGLRVLLISETNFELLKKYYSFADYNRFYEEHFSQIPFEKIAPTLMEQPLRIEGVDQVEENDDDEY